MKPESRKDCKARWTAAFKPLVGRTITTVRWMDEVETVNSGYHRSAIVIQLDDGTLLIPQMDDEGNDAGALVVQAGTKTKKVPPTAPVI